MSRSPRLALSPSDPVRKREGKPGLLSRPQVWPATLLYIAGRSFLALEAASSECVLGKAVEVRRSAERGGQGSMGALEGVPRLRVSDLGLCARAAALDCGPPPPPSFKVPDARVGLLSRARERLLRALDSRAPPSPTCALGVEREQAHGLWQDGAAVGPRARGPRGDVRGRAPGPRLGGAKRAAVALGRRFRPARGARRAPLPVAAVPLPCRALRRASRRRRDRQRLRALTAADAAHAARRCSPQTGPADDAARRCSPADAPPSCCPRHVSDTRREPRALHAPGAGGTALARPGARPARGLRRGGVLPPRKGSADCVSLWQPWLCPPFVAGSPVSAGSPCAAGSLAAPPWKRRLRAHAAQRTSRLRSSCGSARHAQAGMEARTGRRGWTWLCGAHGGAGNCRASRALWALDGAGPFFAWFPRVDGPAVRVRGLDRFWRHASEHDNGGWAGW